MTLANWYIKGSVVLACFAGIGVAGKVVYELFPSLFNRQAAKGEAKQGPSYKQRVDDELAKMIVYSESQRDINLKLAPAVSHHHEIRIEIIKEVKERLTTK